MVRRTFVVFFFNDTATTEIYTLSLHDALPISQSENLVGCWPAIWFASAIRSYESDPRDRKSTRLNSSHQIISYAVFCLQKKILLTTTLATLLSTTLCARKIARLPSTILIRTST